MIETTSRRAGWLIPAEREKIMNATWLNRKQWHNRLKSIETNNLKRYKHSFTVPSIEMDLAKCIIETDMDGNICIDYDLYKELRKTAGI